MYIPHFDGLLIKKLEEKDIPAAILLCNRHVGRGLYTEEQLLNILGKENHLFYLIYHNETTVGYFYCLAVTMKEAAELPGLEETHFEGICGQEAVIGICRSIGIDEQYRGSKLSDFLLQCFTDHLFEAFNVSAIFIPAWVKGDYIPAKRLLEDNNYKFLMHLHRPWFHLTGLECPYCRRHRCICDAVIYYMRKDEYYEGK